MSRLEAMRAAESNLMRLGATSGDADLSSFVREVVREPRPVGSIHRSAQGFGVLGVGEAVLELGHGDTLVGGGAHA